MKTELADNEERKDLSVNSYTPIADFKHGDTIEQIILIQSVDHNDRMKAQNSSVFARVIAEDVSANIEGTIFNYRSDEPLKPNTYYNAKLTVNLYRGNLQFQADYNNLNEFPGIPVNRHDYVKGVTDDTLNFYAAELQSHLESLEDDVYRDIMCSAMSVDLIHALRESPYGYSGPMSYKGGLLVHVVHSIRLSLVAIEQAKQQEISINPSLVIAGCTLRNIGWHTTTRFQENLLRTRDALYMTGTYRASMRFIDHLILNTESSLQIKVPESKQQALENMCNSLSEINTLEGRIVASADNMADILDIGSSVLQRKRSGSWCDDLFVGHLDD